VCACVCKRRAAEQWKRWQGSRIAHDDNDGVHAGNARGVPS